MLGVSVVVNVSVVWACGFVAAWGWVFTSVRPGGSHYADGWCFRLLGALLVRSVRDPWVGSASELLCGWRSSFPGLVLLSRSRDDSSGVSVGVSLSFALGGLPLVRSLVGSATPSAFSRAANGPGRVTSVGTLNVPSCGRADAGVFSIGVFSYGRSSYPSGCVCLSGYLS